jgi:hypothetical protein
MRFRPVDVRWRANVRFRGNAAAQIGFAMSASDPFADMNSV